MNITRCVYSPFDKNLYWFSILALMNKVSMKFFANILVDVLGWDISVLLKQMLRCRLARGKSIRKKIKYNKIKTGKVRNPGILSSKSI